MTNLPGWDYTADDLHRSVMVPEKFSADAIMFVTMASLKKDGTPVIIPLGYWYDREYFYLTMATGRGGVHRLRRDPRVSLNFQTWVFPPHFITVNGLAEEIPDPDHAISLKISHRYPKAHSVNEEEFDRDWLSTGRVVFRIKPTQVVGLPFDVVRDMSKKGGAFLKSELDRREKFKTAG